MPSASKHDHQIAEIQYPAIHLIYGSMKSAHFSAGAVAVGAGAAATGAAAVAGAAVGSGFCSAPKSGSSKGPLVADMPGAGFVVGIAGRSVEGAGAGGSAA